MLIIKVILFLFVISFNQYAYAYKECTVKTSKFYVGDSGILWLNFEKGGAAYIHQDDVNFKNIYPLILAAQMANKNIIIRYKSDEVICNTGTRSDIQGVWLLPSEQ